MEDKEKRLKSFIRKHVHEADRLEEEMKKSLYLGKRKSKKNIVAKSSKKNKFLTRSAKKAMGLFHLPRKGMKYEEALPMYDLWKEYMRDQLELNGDKIPTIEEKAWENLSQLALKADYHGALITVSSSKCPSLVGITGICVIETKNTFKLICKDNIIRTVSKDLCKFFFDMGSARFTIFGKHICKRPAERSVKQSKQFLLSEL